MTRTRIPLRLGGVPEHFNLPWRRLLESRALHHAGIDATWTPFPGGTGAMVQALNNDEVDMAMLLTEGAVKAIAAGGRFRLVSWYTTSPLVWGVHVPASSALTARAELFHHPFVISRPGSGSHLMAMVYAEASGADTSGLTFNVVGGLEGARTALASDGPAVFLWEKFTTQPYVSAGEMRRVDEVPTPWPCFVVAVSERCLERAPEACAVALRAVYAQAFTMTREADAATVIAKRYGLSVDGVAQWLAATTFATTIGLARDELEPAIDQMARLGLITPEQRPSKMIATLDD
ncbi:MAG: ABC transporter substrate-binding protein [Pseudomonadota bacterium]